MVPTAVFQRELKEKPHENARVYAFDQRAEVNPNPAAAAQMAVATRGQRELKRRRLMENDRVSVLLY